MPIGFFLQFGLSKSYYSNWQVLFHWSGWENISKYVFFYHFFWQIGRSK